MNSEYEFQSQIACSFITPILDGVEMLFIAEYEYIAAGGNNWDEPAYDAECNVILVKPKSKTPSIFEIMLADFLNKQGDFEHLEIEIMENISDDKAADHGDYLYQQMKDRKLEDVA